MGHAVLQQLVVNVLAVGGKHGAAADQTPHDRERRLEDRQSEGDDRNRYGHADGGRLLRSSQRECTQHKTNEQAAGVTQEDGSGIEVEAQESENRAGQADGHERDQRLTVQ